jgi:predicted ATPase with chaperone activity
MLQYLYHEKFIEIHGCISFGNNRYAMLDRGWQRAQRLLDINGYIGPAPISLQAYSDMVLHQREARESVTPDAVSRVMSDLVLPESAVQTLGLVASSRRSLFVTGPSGNGKTSIATALHDAQRGEIWIPYAIEVDGQIIKVFDRHNHHAIPIEGPDPYDQRWLKIKRPLVIVGGEMTIETMDLIYSESVRFYEAPFQMKSNGGTLVIDDFGRQRIDPRDLLNRWIVPLEGGIDYLTLHTGKKIEVPFDQLLIFATNLEPGDLVDDAFLRRMGYRLHVTPPTREMYTRIFKNHVELSGFAYDPRLLDFIFRRYEEEKRPLRGCEPRDLMRCCVDLCRYENRPQVLSPELIELAWNHYFGIQPSID